MKPVIIAGCGYLGLRIAMLHQAAGQAVRCLTRSPQSAATLADSGIAASRIDLDETQLDTPPDIHDCLFYYLIPPPKTGVSDPRVGRMISLFNHENRPRRLVYISTTGVYGDCGGDWIDERQPAHACAPRAQRRLSAEEQWRHWSSDAGAELVILRVAGIYGPGRLPLARLGQSAPMLREQEAPYSNRIHVDDLAQVCVAAMQRGRAGEVYNVSDGQPSTMLDYFNRVADLSGLPRPEQLARRQAEQQLSPEMMGYMNESRRLKNDKMLNELGVRLRYPSLAEGLPACFAQEHPTDD